MEQIPAKNLPPSIQKIYLKRRFKRFFPQTFLAFLISFFAVHIYKGSLSLNEFYNVLTSDIWEILLIKMCGLNNGFNLLNAPSWNISALLIVEFILLSLLINQEKLTKTFIIPITLLIGFGYWSNYGIPGPAPYTWVNFTTFGVIRVWLCFSLSLYCYEFMLKIKNLNFNRYGEILLSIIEIVLYISIIICMQYGFSRNYMFLIILLFSLAVPISISKKSYINSSKIFNNKITEYLGKLSFSIFLIHHPILIFYIKYFQSKNDIDFFKYLTIVVLLSIFFLRFVNYFLVVCKFVYNYFCSKILFENERRKTENES